jgi:DNA (cytosine-5)-methyltransferase 1
MNHFSLFSGIGGIDLAAEWAGFHSVGQCEIDEYANKVLEKHWPDVPRWKDIFELKGADIIARCGEIDLLSGGFPCQPFSAAGKRKGDADERHLWPELLRIIREVKPRWFLGENVRGLLSIKHTDDDRQRVFGSILRDLAESGYRVGWICYGAGDVGAPHRRERVFILAHAESRESRQQETGNGGQDTCRGSEEMAHSKENTERSGLCPDGTREEWRGRFGNSGCEKPADTDSERGCLRKTGRQDAENAGQPSRSEDGAERSVEPGLGRVFDEFPAGMDGNWPAKKWPTPRSCEAEGGPINNAQFDGNSWFRKNQAGVRWGIKLKDAVAGAEQMWPAGPGEQYEWEPPRIATGIKDRVSRLKCLGNAVCPQQIYPILKAIAEVENEIHGH